MLTADLRVWEHPVGINITEGAQVGQQLDLSMLQDSASERQSVQMEQSRKGGIEAQGVPIPEARWPKRSTDSTDTQMFKGWEGVLQSIDKGLARSSIYLKKKSPRE